MRITRNNIYHQFLPGIEPCVSISSGDSLTIETLDAAGGRFLEGFVYTRPNPATGPVYVNGAIPGDTLEVEIRDIKLIGKGFLNVPDSGTNSRYEVKVGTLPDGNFRVLNMGASYNDKIFRSKPMIGVIGTAVSPDAQGGWFSTETGDHGGNMDNNAVTAGVKVYLPVFVEGALLGMGDIHGIMGDGEVFGQGVEICADVDITVKIKKDMKINRPLVISDEIISTAASADTMEKAGDLAISDMRFILEAYYNLKPADAALAIAFYGNLRVCQIVNPQKTMRMEIKKDMIDLFKN